MAADAGGDGCFGGKSAYEVLGVLETCSPAEIKASFRRLAKVTHPDVSPSADTSASGNFLQILSAYVILSDPTKRADYDSYLISQRRILQKQPKLCDVMYTYSSSLTITRQREVVQWLEQYRFAVKDIVLQNIKASGSGYLYELENEFYSAICYAYYGPVIKSMDVLPYCFEAEERSACETSEVLHLVSGRDLLGMAYIVNRVPELTHTRYENIATSESTSSGVSCCTRNTVKDTCLSSEHLNFHGTRAEKNTDHSSEAYKDLELHIYGSVLATATRSPPKHKHNDIAAGDSEDCINIFLYTENEEENGALPIDSRSFNSHRSRVLLGTINGLGTSGEEASCSVYDKKGARTHVILKHRTLLVKHMHWFRVEDDFCSCECRCSRAQLPPSKFWLFEPRSSMHDVGGWYIETFGQDKRGRIIPSHRQWNYMVENSEKRLHPAMYLLALAYRTLDLEEAKRRKPTIRNFMGPKLDTILRWCKKLL